MSEQVEAAQSNEAPSRGDMIIYVARHGETLLNTSGRAQGWTDSPLTEHGVQIAEDLGRGLKAAGVRFDAAYSSDLGRAVHTGRVILDEMGEAEAPDLVQLEALREWHFGGFEGGRTADMVEAAVREAGYEGVGDAYAVLSLEELANAIAAADETHVAEDWKEIAARLSGALETVVRRSSASGATTVLTISHGRAINALLHLVDDRIPAMHVPNAAVAKIAYRGGTLTIEAVNDESFVDLGRGSSEGTGQK